MATNYQQWLNRRHLTDSPKAQKDDFRTVALELLDGDHLAEAAAFAKRAEDLELLKSILTRAVDKGNYFVFFRVLGYLGASPKDIIEAATVTRLIAQAESQALAMYADKAHKFLAEHFPEHTK